MIGKHKWGKRSREVAQGASEESSTGNLESESSQVDMADVEMEKDEERVSEDQSGVGDAELSEITSTEEPLSAENGDSKLVDRLKAEAEQNYDKYIRSVAELENVKKRHLKERSELIKYSGENLARDLLEVLDNLQLAIGRHAGDPQQGGDVLKGIQLIADQFTAILERHSIKSESSVGKPFDPQKQEAVATVPTPNEPPGTVIEEFKRAYFFKDKLLRPAQVVVSSSAPANGAESKSGDKSKR